MLARLPSRRKFRLAALAPLAGLALAACATQRTPPAPQATTAAPTASGLSLDTPIGQIDGAPGGRAVLDQDLPGLTSRPEYPMIKTMTLKTLAGLSGGKLTQERLTKVQSDLARLAPAATSSAAASAAPAAPVTPDPNSLNAGVPPRR